jgi:hypothetical protein
MDGANGQTGGKNRGSTFVLTAFISFALFNVFQLFACLNFCPYYRLFLFRPPSWVLSFYKVWQGFIITMCTYNVRPYTK